MAQKHNNSYMVKLLCSYGGKIQSRPTDHQLSYVGGDTKIIAVSRPVNFSNIFAKLKSLTNRNNSGEISLKYQLPGEDLDSLVSLIDDDDVEHMMVEYDRMHRISGKPARLRIFIFNVTAPPAKPIAPEPAPVTPTNPDYLFGFDKEYKPSTDPPLDLLQIPGMSLPEKGRFDNEATIPAEGQAAYRFSAAMNDGVYRSQSGPHLYGYREQPVYHIIPMISPVSEQRMKVSMVNNGHNFLPR